MDIIIIVLKLIVGISILNVWLRNANNSSPWRGGEAKSLKEEFSAYGLPDWSLKVIGFFKVSLSLLLLASIYFSGFENLAALGLAFFLSGSVLMHLKISDPFKKSIPALTFLIICLIIAYL